MGILVLTTGGTIGAIAYEDPQSPPDISTMPIEGIDLVKNALEGPTFDFVTRRCVSLEPRDSKLIDDTYRSNMLRLIYEAPEKEILITHGTDRILESADYFYEQLKKHDSLFRNKTIMLTGSMTPLANGEQSDGYLNLVYALQQLTILEECSSENNGAVFIILCDYEFPETESGLWQPRLYRYRPGLYTKFYAKDGRYNRLKRVNKNDKN